MFRHASPRALFCCAATLTLGLIVSAASAAPENTPVGTWSTANGHGVIAIAQCGDALCGKIVGIDRAPTDPMPTDVHGQSQCALPILTGEKPPAAGTRL